MTDLDRRPRADVAGRTVEPGRARGLPLRLAAPLSFWGGVDATTGCVIEQQHPDCGHSLQGRVMLMAQAKGSSSSSSVLAETLRNGTGPAAIVMREPDLIIAIGAMVARELYAIEMPIVVVGALAWDALQTASGTVTVVAETGGLATLSW